MNERVGGGWSEGMKQRKGGTELHLRPRLVGTDCVNSLGNCEELCGAIVEKRQEMRGS